jgi:DNA polymerase III subunit alpha
MLAGRAGGGSPAGVNPAQWSMAAEGRTMAARGGAAGGAAPGGQAPGAAPGAGGTGGAVAGGAGWALQKIHQAGAALAGQMEQTAAHAGMPGAYPYSTVAGGRSGLAQRRPGSTAPPPARPAAPAADQYQPPFAGGSRPLPDDFGDEEEHW